MDIEPQPDFATPLEKISLALSDVFDTTPLVSSPAIENQLSTVIDAPDSDQQEAITDHGFVRSNMYDLLEQGQSAFHYALELAKQSENPRAFEVVGNLMKNLADMNSQLMDLHEKKSSLKSSAKVKSQEPSKVINNSVIFSGSTAELNNMIQNMKKEQ